MTTKEGGSGSPADVDNLATASSFPGTEAESGFDSVPATDVIGSLLPNEVVEAILSRLDHRTLAACRLVNRAWLDHASDAPLYRQIKFRIRPSECASHSDGNEPGDWSQRLLSAPHVTAAMRSLCLIPPLTAWGAVILEGQLAAVREATHPNLVSMELGDGTTLDASHASELPPGLRAIHVGECSPTLLTHLADLEVMATCCVLDEALAWDAWRCLRRLILKASHGDDLGRLVETIADAPCGATLEALNVAGNQFSIRRNWSERLSSLSSLAELCCDGRGVRAATLGLHIGKCSNLVVVNVEFSPWGFVEHSEFLYGLPPTVAIYHQGGTVGTSVRPTWRRSARLGMLEDVPFRPVHLRRLAMVDHALDAEVLVAYLGTCPELHTLLFARMTVDAAEMLAADGDRRLTVAVALLWDDLNGQTAAEATAAWDERFSAIRAAGHRVHLSLQGPWAAPFAVEWERSPAVAELVAASPP